jgi:hypothetical protein
MQTVFLFLKTLYPRGGRLVAALVFLGISTAFTPTQRCFGSQQIYAKGAGKSAMHTPPGNGVMEKDRRILEQLLAEAQRQPTLASRMKLISARLLGQPYILHPLIGSVSEPEQFVVRMDGFDCVTFIETVLAASTATTVDGFVNRLRNLRYANGEVSYLTRMHYTTDWHAAQVRNGFFQDLTQGPQIAERSKVLNGVPGLPPRNVTVRYFPKSKLTEVSPALQDGDLIYFVAGRRWLDTNHVGLLFRQDGQLRVRHASHRLGGVVEQSLADYFAANEMIGFMVARPVESR